MLKFKELPLHETILSNVEAVGYETPTPIQAQSIPTLLEGHDLLGIAQTGTGKTAAFTLPMIQKLMGRDFSLTPGSPRSLILAPTRELASQIKENLDQYSRFMKIKNAVIFGGVGQANQVAALRNGLDVVIATPGRLLDLMNQGHCRLDKVEIFVLDEADRMLDMGFIHDIKKIIAKLPEKKQTMLFSATMPNEIVGIANRILKNPTRVEVTPPSSTVERINQKIIFCQKAHKYQLLKKVLLEEGVELTLVFTRTKHGANKIVDYLAHFDIKSAAIHGNKSQSARETALENFKTGKIKVLVATDIAARGIDVQGVSHVINFDLPVEAESYVHRIGRTARAGKDGDAISFCDETERDALARIQKVIGKKLPTESFVGTAEQSVKMTQKDRNYRDPRAVKQKQEQKKTEAPKRDQQPRRDESRAEQPRRDQPRREDTRKPHPNRSQGPRDQKRPEGEVNKPRPKVGFKFRNKK